MKNTRGKSRPLRGRLTLWLMLLIICTSALSLLLSRILRSRGFSFGNSLRALFTDFAVRDILLLLLSVCFVLIVVVLLSKNTSDPVKELSEAASQIASGNFDVHVDLSRDRVEEYGELEKNFNRMAEELKGTQTLRREFISGVSHELKTPLSIINGYAKLLEDPLLPADDRLEYAHLIEQESGRLTKMVGNMLRLSRLEHQVILSPGDTFHLDEQMRQSLLLLEPKWSVKNPELVLDLDPVEYNGDEDLLEQLFINLIDNAVKFLPDGGTLRLSLHEADGRIVASIADSGPGIPEPERERVFEQFYQSDTSRKKEGSGLGLPLARRIAELHGGTLAASAAPEGGAELSLSLPADLTQVKQ